MTIRCLIVDDEPLARVLMEEYIRKVPSLQLIGTCEDALQVLEVLRQQEVDLLFMDIQMPHLTGLELLPTLHQKPVVVFTTAYAEYALEGFRLNSIDYLLKPFSFERFVQAVNKALELIHLRREKQEPTQVLRQEGRNKNPDESEPDHLFVKADYKMVKIRFVDILYIEGLKEYVSIFIPMGRIVTLQSLKNLEEILPAPQFIRIHKSYIVPLTRVEAVVGNQVEINKRLLPIGQTYREAVLAALGLEG